MTDAQVEKELQKLREEGGPKPGEEVDLAKRNISRLAQQNSELAKKNVNDLLELYVAMKRAKGNLARINSAMLLGWTQQHVQTSLLKQSFFVVPKAGREHLLQDLASFVVDPESLPDLPITVDAADSIIFDDSAPRQKLGFGVQVLELAAGVHRKRSVSAMAASAEQAVPLENGQATSSSLPESTVPEKKPPVTEQSETSTKPEKPSRVLQARLSDETTERDTAESIALHLKKAFEAGRLHSTDFLSPTTVTFWLTKYQKHVENLAAVWTQGHPTEKPSQFLDFVPNSFCMPSTH